MKNLYRTQQHEQEPPKKIRNNSSVLYFSFPFILIAYISALDELNPSSTLSIYL